MAPLVTRMDPRARRGRVQPEDGFRDRVELTRRPLTEGRLPGKCGEIVNRKSSQQRDEGILRALAEDAGHRRWDAAPRCELPNRQAMRGGDAAVLALKLARFQNSISRLGFTPDPHKVCRLERERERLASLIETRS